MTFNPILMNNLSQYISRAVAHVATAMLFIALTITPISMSAANRRASSTPDFAYPKNVKKDGDKVLAAAIAAGDWQKATLAAIQSVTASNLISNDSVSESLSRLENLSAQAPAEWQPAIMLIEADIYNAIYDNIRWKANDRELPADTFPSSPFEWSRDMFAEKILSLCNAILNNRANDGKPLKTWSGILADTESAFRYEMTIDEFLAGKCAEVLNNYADVTQDIIPFFPAESAPSTPGQKCRMLRNLAIDMLIDKTSARSQSVLEAEAIIEKTHYLPYSLQSKSLISALKKMNGTEGEQQILSNLESHLAPEDLIDGNPSGIDRKEYVGLLRQSIKAFPKGVYVNALKNILANLTNPNVEIQYCSQYLSSSDIALDVTLSNCNESYILVYDYSKYLNASQAPDYRRLAANSRLVKAVKVSAAGEAPFSAKVTAEIGKLPAGLYSIVPSATPGSKGIYPSIARQTWQQPFAVSDISVLSLDNLDATSRVFVVDAADGHPIEGAKVELYSRERYNSPRKLIATLSTNADGYATVSDKNCTIEASYQGSRCTDGVRIYNTAVRKDTTLYHRVSILPDRSIYHPGDSINAVFIAYSSKCRTLSIDKDRKYILHLKDANGKSVASQEAVTDKFGRATVAFRIPDSGMLGNWSLYASDDNGKSYDNAYFQVADYVAPTFFITSDKSENEVSAGDVVNLKGQVLTYSGVPVADAKVNYTVRYRPPMRWFAPSGASYDSSVTTDAEGKYAITLPTANLKDTQFERGVFSVSVSATSPAGETQSGPMTQFALGKEYYIDSPDAGKEFEISESMPSLAFNVKNILGNDVRKRLRFSLKNVATGEIAAEGEFESPRLALPDKRYPSAAYSLAVSMPEDNAVKVDIPITMWRKSDSTAPAGTKLWIPRKNYHAKPGEASTSITIGSGVPDRWIPIVLSGDNKILDFKWLHVVKDNISLPVALPSGADMYLLDVNFISDLSIDNEQIHLYSAESSDKLQITTETFRDKISAGDKEHWKFRFERKYSRTGEIPVLAVMTDAALNHLAPFRWQFNPASGSQGDRFAIFNYYSWNRNRSKSFSLKDTRYLSVRSIMSPQINDYGMQWGIGRSFSNGAVLYATSIVDEVKNEVKLTSRAVKKTESAMISGMAAGIAPVVMDPEQEAPDYADDEAVSADEGASAESGFTDLRESEYPIAFFMPCLTTDSTGMVNIDFIVPNFNTTWAFQLLGYDEDLQTAYKQLETVASKPVMVSTHSPRFVRTGDKIELTATLYNKTGENADVAGRIELVNLLNGEIIASEEFAAESINASGSRIIVMRWTAPSDISSVGFRAYAMTSGHRDGEQALIPVLPATSPIVESTPFWLAPDIDKFEVKLPKFKETDQVTLQYCGNPAWYCLTALPDILQTDSRSVLIKGANLYSNAMAYHLISANSSLKKGLESLLSDKDSEFAALKSNLEKDGNLKIAELANTPWVNDASSETLRMSRLSTLLDDEDAKKTISGQIESLKKMQTSEGGWSWCPDMEPSVFITSILLDNFAMMSRSGALRNFEGTDEMIRSAIGFVDAETLKDYRKYHKKGESLAYLLGWLYTRSSFDSSLIPSGKTANALAPVYEKAIADIAAEWKQLGIREKANAAVLLSRKGKNRQASEILESLRQYASESPEKGIWFDNLASGIWGASSLQTTAAVLNAFAELKPSDKMVDGMRQWLILGRQVQDWGKNRFNVEVVNAILTSGTDWTDPAVSSVPTFVIGSKTLAAPQSAALTGAFTMNLNAKEASSKKLKIKREGNSPAWGGVISQYEAPIKEVKAAEIPELSIRKQVVALVDEGNGSLVAKEGVALSKGMKVRVTLTITNSRDMDYVAITDERSACLEPTDQLSHYTGSDGLRYYKEVRNENTNLFIEYLPKGHHVVSYDCTISQDGIFSCGIATIQSQYAPLVVAHSAAEILKVK